MEIKGTIKKKLKKNGTSKAGNEWQKIDVIIQQHGEYGKEVSVTAFGDEAIESVNRFNEGDSVEVSVNVESREFNGKYYTNITGWKWVNGNNELSDKDMVTFDDDENLPF